MKPFLYDVSRVLRNRGVVLITLLTIGLAFTSLFLFRLYTRPTSGLVLHDDEQTVVLVIGLIFSFFVPLLGIQAGYSTYARDRATGVLESVLVRPVSRTTVILSRYVAVVLATALGIGVAMLLVDGMNDVYFGAFLPLQDILGMFSGLLVEALGFAGILFLIAHVARSPATIMGAAVVTFILIDVIWFFVLTFVGVLAGGLQTVSGLQSIVRLEYTDPSGYSLLMLAYAQGGLFGGFFSTPLQTLGITPAALLVSGLFWSLGPFLVALYLARTRD